MLPQTMSVGMAHLQNDKRKQGTGAAYDASSPSPYIPYSAAEA